MAYEVCIRLEPKHILDQFPSEDVDFHDQRFRHSHTAISESGQKIPFMGRLRLFKIKGITCLHCGIMGNELRYERHLKGPTGLHWNLYHVYEDGSAMMMTKDHIIPKSKGGPNHIDNYQILCQRCNGRKGDSL